MSFFFAVCGLEDDSEDEAFSAAELFSLFVRCALLLLCIIIDTTDFIGDWNVVDVGPQMLPSLVFTSLLILCDFSDTMLEHRMQTWSTPSTLRVLVHLVKAFVSLVYVLFAAIVACHYGVGGFAFLRDFITDTRWTIVHILFIAFIMIDACLAFARGLLKLVKHGLHKPIYRKKTEARTHDITRMATQENAKAFDAKVDVSSIRFLMQSNKDL
jgi:hypothetical protein